MTLTSIADLMQPAPTTIRPTATLREAAEMLTLAEIGVAVVAVNGRMVGVCSERDLVRALADGSDPDDDRVEDVMSLEVLTASSDETIDAVTTRMLEGEVRHLPVADDDKVVGIVSIRDLLARSRG